MIGMGFPSFLTLLVIGGVCAFFFHSMLKLRVLHTGEGYLCQMIMGWLGAWIGSPVLGHWSWMVPSSNVYLVPAILGSGAAIYTLIALFRIVESLLAPLSMRETLASPSEKARVA
jgi:uncharacterized membrane protein YeaQ/YmgE (transglycosylase-associated protein family)